MPTVPISMRKLKEILRLKYGVGLSHRQIGRSLWGGDQFWTVLNMKKIAFRPCVARVCGVSLDSGLF